MNIRSVEPFILHVPVTGSQIADSTHTITPWGATVVDGIFRLPSQPGAGTRPTPHPRSGLRQAVG